MTIAMPKTRRIGSRRASYSGLILRLPSLVGYWPMMEAVGASVFDLSPAGHDGTYVNTPTLGQRPGPINRQDGGWPFFTYTSLEHVAVADHADLDFNTGEDFTIGIWVRLTQLSAVEYIINKRKTTPAYQGPYVYYRGTIAHADEHKAVGRIVNSAGASITAISTTSIDDGVPHLVVLQREGDTGRLFIDGVQEGGDQAGAAGDLRNATPLRFGVHQNATGGPYNGNFGHAFICRAAVAAADLKAVHLMGIHGA